MFGLGSNAQLGIGIAISLNNKFSGQANKVQQSMMDLRKSSQNLAASAVRDYRNTAANISAGAAAVTYGMFRYAEQHSEFQHKINQVYIVGGKELGKSRKELESFARDFSKQFTRNPTEIASALFENVKAGVTTGIEEITRYQVAVATATDEMLGGEEGVAAKLLGIANAMGIPYEQFARVANATTAAANASMSSVRSIGESMEYAAFTAKTFNIPLEQTLALVAKLSQSKITGSAAGTALNNFLMQLSKNAGIFKGKKAETAWQMLGIDPDQITQVLNEGDIFKVVDMLDAAAQKLPKNVRKSALTQLFNIRGDRGLEALMDSMGSGDLTKTFRGLYGSVMQGVQNDIAMKQAKAMQNDVYSDIKFLKQAMFDVGIAFVKAVTPMARILLPVLTKGLHIFAAIVESPLGTVLASAAALIAPLVAVRFGLRALNLTLAMMAKNMGANNFLGGYSGIAGAAWNMAGLSLRAGGNANLPAGLTTNALGRATVAAGQTFSYNGRTYRGGQIVPMAAAPGLGPNVARGQAIGSLVTGASVSASAATAAGGLSGRLAASSIGKLATAGLKYLPMIGVLYSIYEILSLIWPEIKGEKKEEPMDPILKMLNQDYFERMYGDYLNPRGKRFDAAFMGANGRKPFTITINNNIDGVKQNSNTINGVMDENIAKDLYTNLSGF